MQLAFALYGIHRNGTKLDPDEVQTLETFCEVGAQAYARVGNVRYRELAQGKHVAFRIVKGP